MHVLPSQSNCDLNILLHVLSRYIKLDRMLMTMETRFTTVAVQFIEKAIPIEGANNANYNKLITFVAEVEETHGTYSSNESRYPSDLQSHIHLKSTYILRLTTPLTHMHTQQVLS